MSETRRWAPSVLWAGGILVATSIPGSALPPISPFAGADKVVHFAMYGVLAALVGRAVAIDGGRNLWFPLALIALMAAGDEWHQQWVPGRSADVHDWMADMAGAIVGFTYTYMARPRRERRT